MTIKLLVFDWGGVCAQYKIDRFEEFVGLNGCPANLVASYFDKYKPDFDRNLISEEKFWTDLKTLLGFNGPWIVLAANSKKNLLIDWALLEAVRGMRSKIQTALLSNMDKTSIDAINSEVRLKDYFTRAYFSSELGTGKMDDSVIRMICDEFSVRTSEILFIDDFEGNVERGRQAGMEVLLHVDRSGTLDQLRKLLQD